MPRPETLTADLFKRRLFSGNLHAQNAPLYYGWILRLGGPALPAEKSWLKSHGYTFSGGKWCKKDSKPVRNQVK